MFFFFAQIHIDWKVKIKFDTTTHSMERVECHEDDTHREEIVPDRDAA